MLYLFIFFLYIGFFSISFITCNFSFSLSLSLPLSFSLSSLSLSLSLQYGYWRKPVVGFFCGVATPRILLVSSWCHLMCSSIPIISYKLVVRFRGVDRFGLDFLARILLGWCSVLPQELHNVCLSHFQWC